MDAGEIFGSCDLSKCLLNLLLLFLQALAQELNFSAYLGLPVFMIPLKGPHNANLARMLLNHIQTGHHTSNVRQTDSASKQMACVCHS